MSALAILARRYPARRVFITGAGSGLGLCLARRFGAAGWTLGLNDVEPEALAQVAAAADPANPVATYPFDVADEAAFTAAAADFLRRYHGVDLVFNCAGIGGGGLFVDYPLAYWREVLDVNLLGTVLGARAFLPALLAAGRGHIVNVASAAAFHGLPRLSAYVASKAAVLAFSEVLAAELRGSGVRVSVKMTTFYRDSQIGRFTRGAPEEQQLAALLVQQGPISADEAAAETLRQVAAGRFYIVFPRQARLLWFFKRHFPTAYLRFIAAFGPRLVARLRQQAGRASSPTPTP